MSSNQCQEAAQTHGCLQLVNNLQTRIESSQNLVGFEFLRPSFLRKNLGRSFRLIAHRKSLQDDVVVVSLRVLPRVSNDYDYFLKNWESNQEEVLNKLGVPTNEGLGTIHNELKNKSASPLPPPAPNQEESEWLSSVFVERLICMEDDLLVFETKDWVQKCALPVLETSEFSIKSFLRKLILAPLPFLKQTLRLTSFGIRIILPWWLMFTALRHHGYFFWTL